MAIDIYKSGSGGGGGTGEVKVSSDDTTLGYLEGKLTNGYGITFNIANPGGNESLDISINNGDLDGYFALINSDNQPFTYLGVDTLSTALRKAYDSGGNATLDWDLGVLLAYNDISVDWTNRKLLNYAQNEMVDYESGYLKYLSGIIGLEWTSSILRDQSGNTVLNWNDLYLQNAGGVQVYNWDTGEFRDSTNTASANTFYRVLHNATGTTVVDWAALCLYDASSVTTVNWGSYILNGSSGTQSIDWANRYLIKSNGDTTFDYENLAFPTLTTNGVLTTTSGNGTIVVVTSLNKGTFDCTINVATGYIQATQIVLRFRAPYDFQPSEWKMSSLTGGDIQMDIWRNAAGWSSFSSDSICNAVYPELVSSSTSGAGSAATWDPIDKDDYISIYVNTTTTLADCILQVLGDRL
jgi:hypothetical protein